jgi:hypothetical protein
VTSYAFHGSASGTPLPHEDIILMPTKCEWTYIKLDPKTGDPKGNIVGTYEPGAHSTSG